MSGAISQYSGQWNAKSCNGESETENRKSRDSYELRCMRRVLRGRLRVHSVVVEDIPDSMLIA